MIKTEDMEFFKRLYKASRVSRFFILIGLLILATSLISYLLLNKQAADALIEQMLDREQLVARSGANSIETFLNIFGRSLAGLGTRSNIVNFNGETQKELDEYVNRWDETPVAGVIVVNAEGKVVLDSNRKSVRDVGADVSDRDYFKWAAKARKGEIYISEPVVSRVGATKGLSVIPVITPIISSEGTFKGMLVAGILVSELELSYIEPLKITDKTLVYIVNTNGDVLFAENDTLIGKNLYSRIDEIPFIGDNLVRQKFSDVLGKKQEGKLDVIYPVYYDDYKLRRMLMAYSPVEVSNNHFMLAIATPVEDALVYMAPFYFRNFGVIALAFLGFTIIAVRIAKIEGAFEAKKSLDN